MCFWGGRYEVKESNVDTFDCSAVSGDNVCTVVGSGQQRCSAAVIRRCGEWQ